MTEKEAFELGYECYNNSKWKNKGDSKKATWSSQVKDKTIVLCFQQTASNYDWYSDFMFFPKWVKKFGLFVHGGIYRQLEKAKDEIILSVKDDINIREIDNILIYGWSLGGSLAMFMKHLLELEKLGKEINLCTIGAPRCYYWWFNWSKVKKIFTNSYCFENKSDLVPKIPLGLFNIVKHIKLGKFNFINAIKGIDHLQSVYYNNIVGE